MTNNNITNYYFSRTARNSTPNGSKTHRYAKTNFGNKLSETTMVQPDVLFNQMNGQEVDSVGAIYTHISTSAILAITFLNNDKV